MVKFLKRSFWALAIYLVFGSISNHMIETKGRDSCRWGIVYACGARGCTVKLAQELFKWCDGDHPDETVVRQESLVETSRPVSSDEVKRHQATGQ